MKTIKFRAWDKKCKQMINYIKRLSFDNDNNFIEIESVYDLEIKNGQNSGITKRLSSDIVLMQFTGLLDKNGKEVYEFDIVKSGNKRIWTIKFGEYKFSMPSTVLTGYGFYLCPVEEEYQEVGNGCLRIDNGLEIIGNIYENPELLN